MKNKKKYLIIIIAILVLTMTGCTKYVKNNDKQVVTNEKTGQQLVSNILCKPTDADMFKLYKENGVALDNLPACSEFKVTSNGYEGVWTTLFVKPLAWLIIKVANFVKNSGFAIILITLLIRLALYPLTNKTAMQSEVMAKAKPEMDRIEKKYANKSSQEDQMAHSQELMAVYKKYGISPLSGCLFAFIQIPLFFAFYEAMNRLPIIFEGKFLGLELGMSPLTAIFKGHWYYIILVILVIAVTYYSFKLNKTLETSDTAGMNMKMMTNISIIMISIASFSISSAIALYWICNSGFTVIQNLIVKFTKKIEISKGVKKHV